MRDYEECKRYLVKSYELQRTPDCENLLAMCYFELENYKQANQIFIHMMSQSPYNINLMLSSAKCFEKLGDVDMALEQLEKLTAEFPECEEAQEMIRRLS